MINADALDFVLGEEGGYKPFTPSTGDPATNKGVTQGTYDDYRDTMGLARQSVQYITDAEVADIYNRMYWQASGADQQPWPTSLVLFDAAVQHGVGKARQMLATSNGDPQAFIDIRRQYYRNIVALHPEKAVYLGTWLRRMDSLQGVVEQATNAAPPDATAQGNGVTGDSGAALGFLLLAGAAAAAFYFATRHA